MSAIFGKATEHSLPERQAGRHWVYGLSVRTLFDAILSELALPESTPIVCTGINISDIRNIIRAHGLEPIAVDIETDTLLPAPGKLTEACFNSGAKHCLIAHLFGSYSELPDLSTLREAGVTVISDLAQAYDGPDSLNLERNADITLFSFGPIKRKTALGGALAGFLSPEMSKRIERRLESYPAKSDFWFRRRALKYLIVKSATHPYCYAFLEAGCGLFGGDFDALIGGSSRGFGHAGDIQRFRFRPPRRLLALLSHRIIEPPTGEARTQAVLSVQDQLPVCISPVGERAHRHAHWIVPLTSDRNPEHYIVALREFGFDATRGTTSLRCFAPSQAPIADEFMKSVFYIPHPVNMSELDRTKLSTRLATISNRAKDKS